MGQQQQQPMQRPEMQQQMQQPQPVQPQSAPSAAPAYTGASQMFPAVAAGAACGSNRVPTMPGPQGPAFPAPWNLGGMTAQLPSTGFAPGGGLGAAPQFQAYSGGFGHNLPGPAFGVPAAAQGQPFPVPGGSALAGLPSNAMSATGEIDESLANLLMSWYLSGYYTGHY